MSVSFLENGYFNHISENECGSIYEEEENLINDVVSNIETTKGKIEKFIEDKKGSIYITGNAFNPSCSLAKYVQNLRWLLLCFEEMQEAVEKFSKMLQDKKINPQAVQSQIEYLNNIGIKKINDFTHITRPESKYKIEKILIDGDFYFFSAISSIKIEEILCLNCSNANFEITRETKDKSIVDLFEKDLDKRNIKGSYKKRGRVFYDEVRLEWEKINKNIENVTENFLRRQLINRKEKLEQITRKNDIFNCLAKEVKYKYISLGIPEEFKQTENFEEEIQKLSSFLPSKIKEFDEKLSDILIELTSAYSKLNQISENLARKISDEMSGLDNQLKNWEQELVNVKNPKDIVHLLNEFREKLQPARTAEDLLSLKELAKQITRAFNSHKERLLAEKRHLEQQEFLKRKNTTLIVKSIFFECLFLNTELKNINKELNFFNLNPNITISVDFSGDVQQLEDLLLKTRPSSESFKENAAEFDSACSRILKNLKYIKENLKSSIEDLTNLLDKTIKNELINLNQESVVLNSSLERLENHANFFGLMSQGLVDIRQSFNTFSGLLSGEQQAEKPEAQTARDLRDFLERLNKTIKSEEGQLLTGAKKNVSSNFLDMFEKKIYAVACLKPTKKGDCTYTDPLHEVAYFISYGGYLIKHINEWKSQATSLEDWKKIQDTLDAVKESINYRVKRIDNNYTYDSVPDRGESGKNVWRKEFKKNTKEQPTKIKKGLLNDIDKRIHERLN